jgi:hypothetical protein
MAHHLSIFMENKPGKLEKITQILSASEVNIRAISVANAGDNGIVKILCDKPDEAHDALMKNNIACMKRTIIIVLVNDKPGGFHELLSLLAKNGLNILDCYGFVIESKKQAAVVIETEKFPETETVLKNNGIKLLTDPEIYSL